MAGIPEDVRRHEMAEGMRTHLEATIQERISRYIEVCHQGIIANHHFAAASAECIDLYRDGYFLSTVMVTQAVAEGIRRFVIERNEVRCSDDKDAPAVIAVLVEKKIISEECASAFNRIWRSYRNDVHHMNPKVAEIPFVELAKKNIQDLAAIEREIFSFKVQNGAIIPLNRRYWDVREDGKTGVYLRLEG
jgi:hypothetical protein